METKQKTLAAAGAGIAIAAVLGITGASLATAADTSVPGTSGYGQSTPGGGEGATGAPPDGGRGMRDAGGTLTADAASKAVSAALAEVSGAEARGVRALSDGTYAVHVEKSDDTHVHVLVDASFVVTSVEEGGMRGPGGPGRGRGAPDGEVPSGTISPSDVNGSAPTASPST